MEFSAGMLGRAGVVGGSSKLVGKLIVGGEGGEGG